MSFLNVTVQVRKPLWWWQELGSQGWWEQGAGESSSASRHVLEMFLEVWCEILCFQHHPCGLRRLFLPTQGHWFSERRAKNASFAQMETSDKTTKAGLFGSMPLFIVRVWIARFFYYERQLWIPNNFSKRNWFLLSSTYNLIHFFQKYSFRPSCLIYLAFFFFFSNPDAVNVLLHEQHVFCLGENRRGLYSLVLRLMVLEALLMLGNFCLVSRVISEDMQTVHLLQDWS